MHSSVRQVPHLFFCSAETATKPHIVLQQRLPPRETRHVANDLPAGGYRARLRGRQDHGTLVVTVDGASELTWSATDPTPNLACGVDPSVLLENPTGEEVTFVLEVPLWSQRALRPVHLFDLQRFRDLSASSTSAQRCSSRSASRRSSSSRRPRSARDRACRTSAPAWRRSPRRRPRATRARRPAPRSCAARRAPLGTPIRTVAGRAAWSPVAGDHRARAGCARTGRGRRIGEDGRRPNPLPGFVHRQAP